jgi:cytochrome c553
MRGTNWRAIMISGLALAFLFENLGVRSPARAQNTGYRPGTENVIPTIDGPTLYVAYCAVCHGRIANGKGPMAPILKERVPD